MKTMKNLLCLTALLGMTVFYVAGPAGPDVMANNTPQTLPFSQNWTTNLITTTDDWSPVPGIVGFLGDDSTTTQANRDPRAVLTPFTTQDVIANLANATSTSGGVGEFDGIANPTIGLQGSGTADNPNIVLYLNTTGQSNILVSFNARDIDDTADDAIQQLNVQYRVGSTGDFINVPGGYFADVTTGPSQATMVTAVAVTLPAAADDRSLVEVRIMTANAGGSDEWVGIDDISVTTAAAALANDTIADFDGDLRTDISVYRGGAWWINQSTDGLVVNEWGLPTDVPSPADFDGDGKTDLAVWRAGALAYFYILQSGTNTVRIEQFGQTGDVVTVGDWDGDGKADPSVYREGAQSFFYYRGSLANPAGNVTYVPWGTTGDVAVRGDFDGDDKQDAAVFRPSNGVWYIRNSSNGAVRYVDFGLAGDEIVAADYDGDNITDIAVYRPSTQFWYILFSGSQTVSIREWGLAGDVPVPGDYDGDGRDDVAVFRPSNGNWWITRSSNNSLLFADFGQAGDIPLPSTYQP